MEKRLRGPGSLPSWVSQAQSPWQPSSMTLCLLLLCPPQHLWRGSSQGRVGQQKVGLKTFVRELSKNDSLLKEMKWHLANYNRAVNKNCQSAQMAARALQSQGTHAGNWKQVNTGGRPRTSLLGRMTSREGASSSIRHCQKIREVKEPAQRYIQSSRSHRD